MKRDKSKESPEGQKVQGCITKRDKAGKIWQIRIYLGRDERGRRIWQTETIHGCRRDAEKRRAKLFLDNPDKTLSAKGTVLLHEYLMEWMEAAQRPKLRERSFIIYQKFLTLYIEPALGSIKVKDLKPIIIQKAYNSLLDRGLAPQTVRHCHMILSGALSQAVKWDIIPNNPCSRVELPKAQHKEMQALSPDQAQKFLQAAEADRYGVVMLFALISGCRPGEYLALQWKDIDLQAQTAIIQRTIARRPGGGFYFAETKTNKGRRLIPIPASLVETLRSHRRTQNEQRLRSKKLYQDNDLVFGTRNGTPILQSHAQLHFKAILKAAGLPNSIRLYDLRHSCATLLLAAGENPKVISERLGHSSIAITMDVYSHVLPSMQVAATDKLERILNRK